MNLTRVQFFLVNVIFKVTVLYAQNQEYGIKLFYTKMDHCELKIGNIHITPEYHYCIDFYQLMIENQQVIILQSTLILKPCITYDGPLYFLPTLTFNSQHQLQKVQLHGINKHLPTSYVGQIRAVEGQIQRQGMPCLLSLAQVNKEEVRCHE